MGRSAGGLLACWLLAAVCTSVCAASTNATLVLPVDVTIAELTTAAYELSDPLNNGGVRVTVARYSQTVTLRTTLQNAASEADGSYQRVFIGAVNRAVGAGGPQSATISSLAAVGADSVAVTHSIEFGQMVQWSAEETDADFLSALEREIDAEVALGAYVSTIVSVVTTAVSLEVDAAAPGLEAGLTDKFRAPEAAAIPPGGGPDLAEAGGGMGTVTILVIVVAALACVCCVLPSMWQVGQAEEEGQKEEAYDAANQQPAEVDPFGSTQAAAHDERAPLTATSAATLAQASPTVQRAEEAGVVDSTNRPVTTNEVERRPRDALSLSQAVFCGDATAIAQFAHDVNEKTQGNFSPLHIAVRNNDVASAKELLLHGADVNASTRGGSTALCRAAQAGHAQVMKLLLEHPNIEINQQRKTGRTALFLAVQNGHRECVQLLIENAAAVDMCVVDKTDQFLRRNWTALQYADQRAVAATSSAEQARYAAVASMLRAASPDGGPAAAPASKHASPSEQIQPQVQRQSNHVPAGGARGVPVVPQRDHNDLDDSEDSDENEATSSTGGMTPTLNAAGAQAVSVKSVSVSTLSGKPASRPVPVVPSRAELLASPGSDSDSDSDSDGTSESESESSDDISAIASMQLDARPIPGPTGPGPRPRTRNENEE